MDLTLIFHVMGQAYQLQDTIPHMYTYPGELTQVLPRCGSNDPLGATSNLMRSSLCTQENSITLTSQEFGTVLPYFRKN